MWLKRLQYGDEGHCDATALVYRRIGGARRLFLTGSATGLMATRQDLLIAEVSADTGGRVHHAVVDGGGADDGGAALAVDASGNAFAAGWTTDATSKVVHAFVARMSADGTVPWTDALWLPDGDNEAYFQAIDLDAAGNVVCGGYGVTPGSGPEGLVESYWPTGGRRWFNLSSGTASCGGHLPGRDRRRERRLRRRSGHALDERDRRAAEEDRALTEDGPAARRRAGPIAKTPGAAARAPPPPAWPTAIRGSKPRSAGLLCE